MQERNELDKRLHVWTQKEHVIRISENSDGNKKKKQLSEHLQWSDALTLLLMIFKKLQSAIYENKNKEERKNRVKVPLPLQGSQLR